MAKSIAVFEGVVPTEPGSLENVEFRLEDGGQAKIIRLEDQNGDELFVRIQSWDAQLMHAKISQLDGQRVRVTVEVLS